MCRRQERAGRTTGGRRSGRRRRHGSRPRLRRRRPPGRRRPNLRASRRRARRRRRGQDDEGPAQDDRDGRRGQGRASAAEHFQHVLGEARPERSPARIHPGREEMRSVHQRDGESRPFYQPGKFEIFADRRRDGGVSPRLPIRRATDQHELARDIRFAAAASTDVHEVLAKSEQIETARNHQPLCETHETVLRRQGKKAEPSLGLRHRACDERRLGAHVRIDEGQPFRIGRGRGRPAPAGLRLARPAGLQGAAAQASDERVTLCELSDDFVGAVVGIVVDDSDAELSRADRFGRRGAPEHSRILSASLRAGTIASTAAAVRSGRRVVRNEGSQSGALAQCPYKQEQFQEQQRCGEKQLHGLTSRCLRNRRTQDLQRFQPHRRSVIRRPMALDGRTAARTEERAFFARRGSQSDGRALCLIDARSTCGRFPR